MRVARFQYYPIAFAFCIMAWLIAGCNRDEVHENFNPPEDPLEPKPVITTSVSGVVVDEHGKPVQNATVSILGETIQTNATGGFLFSQVEVPGNRCVVQAEHEGYFPASRAHKPLENTRTDVRLVLMESPVTHTFEIDAGINATVEGGSKVKIEPNSLVTSSGAAYFGNVNMSVRYLNPVAENFGVLVPGGDMIATRTDESTATLYSYGILRVVIRGDDGQILQVAPGQTSSLTMAIPDEQLSTAPESIPLWYFDEEKGVWIEDGSAKKEGNSYVGTVTHFTDWNCDLPTEGATIVGRLIDCKGNPAWGQVEFGQIATDPQSSTESNESDGRFSQRVPDGVSITVVISDPLIISPLTQFERGKVIVVVPPLAPGQVYDVGDIQTFPCPVDVTGSIITKANDEAYAIFFETDAGVKPIFNLSEGQISTSLPADYNFSMTVYTMSGVIYERDIETPAEGVLDLGVIDLSGDNTIEDEVTIKGVILCYGESETEGQISVSWESESGTSFNYAAPNEDGTFEITAPARTTVVVRGSTEHGSWERTIETVEQEGQYIDLGVIEICETDVVGESSFVINGDGYTSTTFTITPNVNIQAYNAAVYYPTDELTICYLSNESQSVGLVVHFTGKELGAKVNGEDAAGVSISLDRDGVETTYWANPDFEGSEVSISITKYEAVGGAVEGNFSGTFLVTRNGSMTGETVTITNGKFSALRYDDAL